MPASVSGGKTVTKDVAPHLTAAAMTTLLATAVENLTVAQLRSLKDAVSRIPGGGKDGATIGSLLA